MTPRFLHSPQCLMVWLSSGCSLSLSEVFRLFPFPTYCQDSYKNLISLRSLSNWDRNWADIYFKRENKPQSLSVKRRTQKGQQKLLNFLLLLQRCSKIIFLNNSFGFFFIIDFFFFLNPVTSFDVRLQVKHIQKS